MGLILLYEDKREVIPVIQTSTGLEYDITTKIKSMVEKNKQTALTLWIRAVCFYR